MAPQSFGEHGLAAQVLTENAFSSQNPTMSSPRYTLRQLEIFLAVADTLNVTRAAESLHLSPSATSAAITELERAVNTELCVRRKGRGVELTDEGRTLAKLASNLLDDASAMAAAIASYSGTISGTLRLGCYSPVTASSLPELMQGFTTRYPAVDIQLIQGIEADLHTQMLDGLVDVAIGYDRPSHPELQCIHLAARRPHVVVSKQHAFADRPHVGLAAVAEEPLILLDVGSSKDNIMAWFAAEGVTPNVRWVTHDVDLARALVGRGLGVSVLMQRQRHDLTVDGFQIRMLEIDPPVRPLSLCLVTTPAAWRTERVRAFIDHAREIHREPGDQLGADATQASGAQGAL